MKKILIHCPMPFYGTKNISKILKSNLINQNSGNLLYYAGVARTIMTDDCDITTMNLNKKLSADKIDEINNVYDFCIIPLADAFRNDFVKHMSEMTNTLNKLKIPCFVVCCGISKSINEKIEDMVSDKEVIQAFIRAVLAKSATIGLRGNQTAEFLKYLGFKEDRDFTVVGCPSMYFYGDNLPMPDVKKLTSESKVSVSLKPIVHPNLYNFVRQQMTAFNDCTLISQVLNELKTLYVSYPYVASEQNRDRVPSDWPVHVTDLEMASGKMIGVVCPETWIEYLKSCDFIFGTRIHGNIAGLLAGVPAYIMTDDTRVQELAEYHNIPHTLINDITENTSIFDLYEHADYSKLHVGHTDRVSKWLSFLDKNGIPHVSRDVLNSNNAPYDIASGKMMHAPVFKAFSAVDVLEQERRIKEYITTPA